MPGSEADSFVFPHWAGCLSGFLRNSGCHPDLVGLGSSVFVQQVVSANALEPYSQSKV